MPSFQASPLFSDHAVLARGKEIRVFGAAEKGVQVTAELQDGQGNTLARDTAPEKDGRFLCLLPPQEARTGCVLTLTCGEDRARFTDVAIGDVFLAGGQSNMELELRNADEGAQCIRTHDDPLVRYFNVPKCALSNDAAERQNRAAHWVRVEPGAAADMSAAAYFFAMKWRRETGAPVGIVDCYWGGTSITCWMDEETLSGLAEGRRYLEEYRKKSEGVTMEAYLQKEKEFLDAMDAWGQKVEALRREKPDITWPEINARAGLCPWNPPAGPGSPYRPGGLYETMLRRTAPLALTGVLFYQGEEDTWRTARYDELLTAFILMLRRRFDDARLPFINVQLPMWIADGAQDSFTWPRLRLAQQRVWDQLANTGLVPLLDQGEYDNIHPTAKRVVGERLAEEAKRVALGLPAQEAPRALVKQREGSRLRVKLSQAVKDRGTGDFLMEVAGADGAFYPAETAIDGKEIVLEAPQVERPVSARYAWTDYAAVRLFGENGWPLMPFWL